GDGQGIVQCVLRRVRWGHCRCRPHPPGSETAMPAPRPAVPLAKPLKRPWQARAQFSVQAIYDAFVRIWQREGWARLTTRAVALAAGTDLPRQPDAAHVRSLVLAVWGGRRYLLLVRPGDISAADWIAQMESICLAALSSPSD